MNCSLNCLEPLHPSKNRLSPLPSIPYLLSSPGSCSTPRAPWSRWTRAWPTSSSSSVSPTPWSTPTSTDLTPARPGGLADRALLRYCTVCQEDVVLSGPSDAGAGTTTTTAHSVFDPWCSFFQVAQFPFAQPLERS